MGETLSKKYKMQYNYKIFIFIIKLLLIYFKNNNKICLIILTNIKLYYNLYCTLTLLLICVIYNVKYVIYIYINLKINFILYKKK